MINNATNLYGVTKWIVDPVIGSGTQTTIAAAIAAASPGDTIFIRPGTYTENLTMSKNLTLVSFSATGDNLWEGSVVIVGQITTSGNISFGINGIDLVTNGGNSINVTDTSSVVLQNCILQPSGSTSIFMNNVSCNVTLENCTANLTNSGNLFTVTSGSLRIQNCNFDNGSSTVASTVASGFVSANESTFNFPVSTSSSGVIRAQNSIFSNTITTAGTGSSYFNGCYVTTGSSSAFSIGAGTTATVVHTDMNSSNTNVLTGSGTLQYALLSFSGSSSGHNVSTETALPTLAPVGAVTVNVQTFTTTGTYTPTAGMEYCIIECWGGGGAGGGVAGTAANFNNAGGGGAGGYSRKFASASTIGSSQTVTIGAAGSPGTAGNNPGGNGGATSVGSICVANGGTGGGGASTTGNGSAGAGGTAGTGDIAATGQPGTEGITVIGVAVTTGQPGAGGSTIVGGGGKQIAANGAGQAGTGNGSGGSGASQDGSGSTFAGGAGTAGYVVITEYI